MCGMENEMQANQEVSEHKAADKVDEEAILCADIVTRVPEAYFFEGWSLETWNGTDFGGDWLSLCNLLTEMYGFFCFFVPYHEGMTDYQHVIPVHTDVARRKKRKWSEAEDTHGEYFVSTILLLCLSFLSVFNGYLTKSVICVCVLA